MSISNAQAGSDPSSVPSEGPIPSEGLVPSAASEHAAEAAATRARHSPNHHLWRNGRRWWIAFTVHTADGRRLRVRRSLRTTDVQEARRRRDVVFARAETQSALRLAGSAAQLGRPAELRRQTAFTPCR